VPNAQGDEVSDDGANAQDIDQSEAPKPDIFRLQIYEKANQYLGEFMQNPKDAKAKSELDNPNKQVKEPNVKDKLPKDLENFLIQVPTFIANFEIAKGHLEASQKDPADDKARENLAKIKTWLP